MTITDAARYAERRTRDPLLPPRFLRDRRRVRTFRRVLNTATEFGPTVLPTLGSDARSLAAMAAVLGVVAPLNHQVVHRAK
ncbi:hypothetical protein HZZ00_20060 [Streptomyces sp. NEAU-sy36]|uniref:hypothetical protein n=1 Tax=unclassified Streptomyces TaxID=2593676 RepID=UPI0015D5BE4A|nr:MULTISPECIES: hypothetical protein [unclassified Streptomyces]QLJ03051.1 hypothetical protein HZZ00_20060 [Streptomyces sp. NEAU-sy36]